jgi:hypothetical protein
VSASGQLLRQALSPNVGFGVVSSHPPVGRNGPSADLRLESIVAKPRLPKACSGIFQGSI